MSRLFKLNWKSVGLLILALCGVALVLVNTRWGPYLGDDSYYYIYPAQNLVAGKGFNPSYIFGPMFPAVLAAIALTGLNVFTAVRGLNAVLMGVNIFLVGLLTRRLNVPAGFSLLAAGLVLVSDVVVEAHGAAMSEALAFTFILSSLIFCLDFIADTRKRVSFWLAAIAAGLAVLTRYACLPLIGALGLTLLIFPVGKRFVSRLKDAVLLGATGLAPVALYWVRNQLVSGHPVRYLSFVSAPFTHADWTWFMYNWFSLFVPGRLLRGREILAGVGITAACLLAAAGLAWAYRHKLARVSSPQTRAGLFLLAAVIILNFAMLYIAHGLTQLDVLNTRYLVPILIVFIILLVGSLGLLWQASGRRAHLAIAAFFAIFLVYYGVRTVDFSSLVVRVGSGYFNVGWRKSETVAYILAHPDLTTMVSTGEMGIYFWTGRMPQDLATFGTPQALKDYLCQSGAPLFIMNQMPTEMYGLEHDEVVKVLALVKDFNDGQMYGCPTQ